MHASPAIRAQQTAEPVAAAHGLDVEVLDGVHEVFVGDLEGRSDEPALEAFHEVYAAWWRGDLDARLPGGESALDLRARFLPAVEQLAGARRRRRRAGQPRRRDPAGGRALLGDTAETWYVPNTGLVVLRREAPGWVLESLGHRRAVRGDVTAGGAPA